MIDQNYSSRIDQEIQAYREVENIHDLPDVYHLWAGEYLLPRMQDIFDTGSVVLFYVNEIIKKCEATSGLVAVVSIGAGYGFLEVEMAQELLARKQKNFQIQCLEISPALINRANQAIDKASVGNYVNFIETDVNSWSPEGDNSIDVVIANQFLHHVVELESLFKRIHSGLKPNGVFMTTDMIGRNGHMRWPEAETILSAVWQMFPDRYKYNHQLQRVDAEFVNWDCSVEGFEGIRAQDILPLLVKQFHFQKFLAFGNLPDLFIDRAYGHNFDPLDQGDMAFIKQLTEFNDELIDQGVIKPTMLIACMAKRPAETSCYRQWTPEFCIRDPDKVYFQAGSENNTRIQREITSWVNKLDLSTIGLDGITQQLAKLQKTCRNLRNQTDHGSSLIQRLQSGYDAILRRLNFKILRK
jgi:SAM-dependent methyltransferase